MARLRTKFARGGGFEGGDIGGFLGGIMEGYLNVQQLQQQQKTQDLRDKLVQLHIDAADRQQALQEQNQDLAEQVYPSAGRQADILRDIYKPEPQSQVPMPSAPMPSPEQITGFPTVSRETVPLSPEDQVMKSVLAEGKAADFIRMLGEQRKAQQEAKTQAILDRYLQGQGQPGQQQGMEPTGFHQGPGGVGIQWGRRVPPDPLKDLSGEAKDRIIRALGKLGLAYNQFDITNPKHQQIMDSALGIVEANRDTNQNIKEEISQLRGAFYGAMAGLAGTREQSLRGELPINPKDIAKYIDINGRTPQADPRFANQADRTISNLNAAGYRALDPQATQGLRMSGIAKTQLIRIKALVDELYQGIDPGMNLVNAIKLKVSRGMAQEKIKELDTLRYETMPAMALSSGLTAGRVGAEILQNVEKPMLPTDNDSYQSAMGKLKQLWQRLDNNQKVFYGTGTQRTVLVRRRGTTGKEGMGTLELGPGEMIPVEYEAIK